MRKLTEMIKGRDKKKDRERQVGIFFLTHSHKISAVIKINIKTDNN